MQTNAPAEGTRKVTVVGVANDYMELSRPNNPYNKGERVFVTELVSGDKFVNVVGRRLPVGVEKFDYEDPEKAEDPAVRDFLVRLRQAARRESTMIIASLNTVPKRRRSLSTSAARA